MTASGFFCLFLCIMLMNSPTIDSKATACFRPKIIPCHLLRYIENIVVFNVSQILFFLFVLFFFVLWCVTIKILLCCLLLGNWLFKTSCSGDLNLNVFLIICLLFEQAYLCFWFYFLTCVKLIILLLYIRWKQTFWYMLDKICCYTSFTNRLIHVNSFLMWFNFFFSCHCIWVCFCLFSRCGGCQFR